VPSPVKSPSATCSHMEESRALDVLPCVRCGAFVCERCRADLSPRCRPCRARVLAPVDARRESIMRGALWSAGGGVLPVLATLFVDLPASVFYLVAVVGGIWGGVRAGNRILTSILYCIPGLATSLGVLFAAERYLDGRDWILTRELGLFCLLGAIPGLLAWTGANRALRRLELEPDSIAALGPSFLPSPELALRCLDCGSTDVAFGHGRFRCSSCGGVRLAHAIS
jgi:hypothetical protein